MWGDIGDGGAGEGAKLSNRELGMKKTLWEMVADYKRELVTNAMRESGGSRVRAAILLGVNKDTINNILAPRNNVQVVNRKSTHA